jgi:hypothetical protein
VSALSKIEALQEQIKALSQEALNEVLVEVMNILNTNIIGWKQYTPYFNDGDPCEFSVNDIWSFVPKGEAKEDDYAEMAIFAGYDNELDLRYNDDSTDDVLYFSVDYLKGYAPPNIRARELRDAISRHPLENAFRSAFGDHASVVITRDAPGAELIVHISEFEHD